MPERPATSWWQAARWDDVRTLKSQREREAKEVALRDARRAKQARATAEEHVKDLIEQVRQHERRGHRAHAALAEIIGRPD